MINVFQLKLQISLTFVFYTYKSFTSDMYPESWTHIYELG